MTILVYRWKAAVSSADQMDEVMNKVDDENEWGHNLDDEDNSEGVRDIFDKVENIKK